jgi:mannitol-specific phosphotransferase system IIBC component
MGNRLTIISLALAGSLLVSAGCGSTMDSKDKVMKKDDMMQKEEMMKKDKMMKDKSGERSNKDPSQPKAMWKVRTARLGGIGSHHAAGTALVSTGRQDAATLTLANLSVDRVPDGRVYLAKGGDYTKAVELGKLRQTSGTVVFAVPNGIMPEDYDSVVIWCKKFNVGIGRAFFEANLMDGAAAIMKK